MSVPVTAKPQADMKQVLHSTASPGWENLLNFCQSHSQALLSTAATYHLGSPILTRVEIGRQAQLGCILPIWLMV